MLTRKLGPTPFDITTIGLGTWAIGGGGYEFGWGSQDDDESIAALRRGLELGVNWIDTAPAYGFGRAERIVAEALNGVEHAPAVFTKCSRPCNDSGEVISSLKRDSILREFEGSLERLRTDVIDLYQIHRPWPEEDIAEGWSTLAELRDQGVARAIGVSYFSLEQLRMVHDLAPVDTLQPQYNLLDRSVEEGILPFCAEQGIGTIVYS